MSDELRAAIVRVRLCQQEGPDVAYPNAKGGEYIRDMDTLTEAYLAEHPADDGEPVTAEWLRVVSPGPFRNGVGWPIACDATGGPVLYCVCTPGVPFDWYLCGHNRLLGLPDQPTRGHVRRLLITLGITPTPKG